MLIDDVMRARRAGAPLLGISTADQFAVVTALTAGINGGSPIIEWDIVRGAVPKNEEAEGVIAQHPQINAKQPADLLRLAADLPRLTVLIVHNAQYYLANPVVCQAICNLRDTFKADNRMLVLMAPALKLPPELAQDFIEIDDPLPADSEIRNVLTGLYQNAGQDKEGQTVTIEHDDATLDGAVSALRGLSHFPVETAAAMGITPQRTIDMRELRRRMRKQVSQTKGLIVEEDDEQESMDDLAGGEQIKEFNRLFFAGRRPCRLVVFLDEAEKMIAGAGSSGPGDSSGVTQDQLGTILTEMESRKYRGQWYVGPPGTMKSAMAKAIAKSMGLMCVRLDLGGAKGPRVGDSEGMIRACLKTIYAMAGRHGALFIATSNKLDNVPPELERRFNQGIWFFDLPTAEERKAIGNIHAKRCELEETGAYFEGLEGWSGANIRDCCDRAYELNCTLAKASRYIVPAGTQNREALEALRKTAEGRFLSANAPGVYQIPKPTKSAIVAPKRALHELN